MKRRIVLALVVIAIGVTLLAQPNMKSADRIVPVAEAADWCQQAHEACAAAWLDDYYESCVILGDTSSGYNGCYCKSRRHYQNCMTAHGCSAKGWEMMAQVPAAECFTPQ